MIKKLTAAAIFTTVFSCGQSPAYAEESPWINPYANPVRVETIKTNKHRRHDAPHHVIDVINSMADKHGVPRSFAVAIARHESRFNCRAIGRAGEHGLFQIKPATARGIGFSGPASALLDCATGANWGILHLKIALNKCGTIHGAATLHNRGLGASCVASAYSNVVRRKTEG